ncbi:MULTISPECIES: L-serine ammonia-lyase, iron-sulfur-dependent, subunit alpha [unclassified Breznakia]|uniref:L-serine ammonia-lyase, iron-sulfur-dependent, subunit alpha n=1 Tax=unclassified Breznakia TaxID=2623764 RepID=UPI0024765050|nr:MULTISPECIES: L-serine ammonia-lyase, iron-sulfur-dependent, subunit alpha [unclassified Breznakia]MDH6366479.1 L-serine dehydratase [Breznakia sp. PH1-1]MDH6403572.1 L-serine dehydratase [Breznakia sp. PF1-11]MDH6411281.1 L-serine dehydratase [Breznakia sp. PFB1-11]MDH6413743.1 L-serine dehydratase [Breznakia sp. PFB1-14]MDH6415826.1 L-serine dehydratase [Breznakia sp. PFB1-4]
MFKSAKELFALTKKENCRISQIMVKREMEVFNRKEEDIYLRMEKSWTIMKQAAHKPIHQELESMGGFLREEAKDMQAFIESGKSFCGELVDKAVLYALAVSQVNASMGLIVAAPTAGASGVLPGCFVALQEVRGFSDKQIIEALYNASAIGYLTMRNANVSGAQGGCQAEVGTASAMAASAIVELMGGSVQQSLHAASHAFMNILGLVCDPICGLVEVPCQTRNTVGATNALICAQMAMSGIANVIPLDDMIEVMENVGHSLPATLRETAMGGSAKAKHICKGCK